MIIITNKNIYYTPYDFLDINSIEDAKIINPKDIIKYLSDVVIFGESLTFKRLFDIVSYNVLLFNQIFYKSLGGFPIDPYLQEIENNITEKLPFDYIELVWQFENYDNELDLFPVLHGASKTDGDITYALDFVSLNNIKDYNIKLNTELYYNNYKMVLDDDKSVDFRNYLGEKKFTLFDVYESIFDEISFHGGPQDKKEIFDILQEEIDDIENNTSESYKSFKDVIDDFEKNDIYLVKYLDDKCRVDKNRLSDNKNLNKLKSCLIEKLKIYNDIKNNNENLDIYYKKLTDIEYNMQLLYNENEDISYHKFWETPKCTCPKIDNIEIYPSKNPIFSSDCPIHKKM